MRNIVSLLKLGIAPGTKLIIGGKAKKHAIILIHVQRGTSAAEKWQLNFMCGWKQLSIDSLEHPRIPLSKMLSGSVVSLINTVFLHITKTILFSLV